MIMALLRLVQANPRAAIFTGLIVLTVLAAIPPVLSQSTPQAVPPTPAATSDAATAGTQTEDASAQQTGPERIRVEADVSTRSVSVTSSFTGVEIVVFGSIDNAPSPITEAGLYDIAVVVKGVHQTLTARRKSKRAGIWINTEAVTFVDVPSYYAISSTRPIDELADEDILTKTSIGFAQIPMEVKPGSKQGVTDEELGEFRAAIARVKQRERLYQRDDYGVVFVGRNLFRTTIDLPANTPVGPLDADVHLFRNGTLLDTFTTRVTLERTGLERYLHIFAFSYPLFYGIFCVLVAVLAGLTASFIVQRIRRS